MREHAEILLNLLLKR